MQRVYLSLYMQMVVRCIRRSVQREPKGNTASLQISLVRLWYGSFTGLLNHLVTYTCSLSHTPSNNFVHDK